MRGYVAARFWGHLSKWLLAEIYHQRQWANGLKSSMPFTGWKQNSLKCWDTNMPRQKFALKHLDGLKRVVDLLIRWDDWKAFHLKSTFQSEIICKRLREDAPRPPAEKGSNNARSGFPFLIMLNVDPFTIVTVTILWMSISGISLCAEYC